MKKHASSAQWIAALVSAVWTMFGADTVGAQDAIEEITVTGSRIVRRDLTSSSPILSIEAERFEDTGATALEHVLNGMPHFVPAKTQFDTTDTRPNPFATPGIATVSLRGLGANRSLVLIDGRRAQPGSGELVVDLNSIPAAAIQRVETITGGASAVYGADALAGVVNFILKDNFEGVEMGFKTGLTGEGDGAESNFSVLLGMNSADDRGNIMLGVDWTKREAVATMDRDWAAARFFDPNTRSGSFIHAPAYSPDPANPPDQAVVDALFARYGAAPGQVPNTSIIYFNPDGTPFINGQGGLGYNGPLMKTELDGQGYTGVKFEPDGTLGQAWMTGNISSALERHSVFGRGQVDLSENLTVFVQGLYTGTTGRQEGPYTPSIGRWSASIPFDDRAIPNDLRLLLESRPDASADWSLRRVLDFLGNTDSTIQTDVYQVLAGIEGALPISDWTYEAYVATGRTTNESLAHSSPSNQRFGTLAAAPNWGRGGYAYDSFYYQSCTTGLPIFGGEFSADCEQAILSKKKERTQVDQRVFEASMQGKIAEMPAGELRFAAGLAHRESSFLYLPSETNEVVSVVEQPMTFPSAASGGDIDVSEVYGELLVPLTRRLELELGYRYSEYNLAGTVDTWKSLFSYAATDRVRFRGGFQRANRAPNAAELFTSGLVYTVPFVFSDPCKVNTAAEWGNVPSNPNRQKVQDLCRALIGNDQTEFDTNPLGPDGYIGSGGGSSFSTLITSYIRGNPDLQSEEADTWTLGVVMNGVGGLDNLVASLDFYNIQIAGAIAPLDPQFAYAICFNANGTNPDYVLDDPAGMCQYITRDDVTGSTGLVDGPYVNAGILETAGLDVTLNWSRDLARGVLGINTVATILDRYETQDNPQAPVFDAAGTLDQGGQFDYRFVTNFNYTVGNSSIGLQWRHFPEVEHSSASRDPNTRILPTESYNLINLYARHAFTDRLELRAGIDNLFDEDPPIVGADPGTETIPRNNNLGSTMVGFYDPLGRRYYLGLHMAF